MGHPGPGGRALAFDAVWSHDGHDFRRHFKVPASIVEQFTDKTGRVMNSRLAMHYVPSKPEVASLDILQPDPLWVSLSVACIGFCVLCGVVIYLISTYRRQRK